MKADDSHMPDAALQTAPGVAPETAPSAAPGAARGAEASEAPLPDLLDELGPERHYVVRALLLVGAVLCVAAGIIGWLIPVMPGFPFYILGAVMAGMASRRVARFLNRQERKLPARVRLLLRPKLRRARRDEDRAARGE